MTPAAKNIIISKLLQINSDSLFNKIAAEIRQFEKELYTIKYVKERDRHHVTLHANGVQKFIGSRKTREEAEKLKQAYANQYTTITVESSL